jgi:hypothetical protein
LSWHDTPVKETSVVESEPGGTAEYTVTAKTTDINSRIETLIADVIKIDTLIIVDYISSVVAIESTLDLVFILYISYRILNYFGK